MFPSPSRSVPACIARAVRPLLALVFSVALSGCLDGATHPAPVTYAIGGTVSGLSGTGLVLRNNGGGDLAVAANGAFQFATKLPTGAAYEITVATQPHSPAQICTVGMGAGNVAGADVTAVTVTCVNAYTVGGRVSGLGGGSVVLQDNAGDDLTVAANGTFTFSTLLPVGADYAVTIMTQPAAPAHACVVSAGSGTIVAANITNVAIDCAAPVGRFAYVANSGAATVSAYAIGAGGVLTAIAGSPFPSGVGPYQLQVAPSGKFVYVVNEVGNSVSGYSVNAASGALTALAGSPFAVGTQPQSLAFTPSGAFLYVANTGSNTLSGFAVDATTGALTPLAGSPFTAGTGPAAVVVDPLGKFAIVANQGSSNVSVFQIGAATGSLTAVAGSPFAAAQAPYGLGFGAGGKFVYAAAFTTSGVVLGYTLNATTGALTAFSPALTAPVDNYVSTDPSGAHLYVAVANSVAAYTIDPTTGALTAVAGSPFAAGTNAYSTAVDPSGTYLYVGNDVANTVGAYTIDATSGVLTPASGSAIASGANPDFITIL